MSAITSTVPNAADGSPVESDPADIQAAFDGQLDTALQWRTSTAAQRLDRIRRLRQAMMAERDALYDAFRTDLAKPPAEVDATELLPVMDEIRHALAYLRRWMKPVRAPVTALTLGTAGRVHYQPRGRSLIIAPWNYPLNLCLGPLVSALAAGNTAIVKPSEMTPSVSGLLARIVATAFPPTEVALFEGGTPTAQALLDLPFDHIFFTGSPAVGKLVMAAAARNLTSVTLELGGKSPTIVGRSADIRQAARTILWGKFLNDGQTCVAPDHVYVHSDVREAFVAECRTVLAARFGDTADRRQASPDLARIVNPRHARRIAAMLADACERGATVLAGGEVDVEQRYVAPTILDGAPPDAQIWQEEIFGPLLPLRTFTDIETVIADIGSRPKPLALYLWSRDRSEIAAVMGRTSSGGACINHCVVQFAHGGLPFGGVNGSGIGNAHGHYGFKAFSHERAVLTGGPLMPIALFFPPYKPWRQRLIRRAVDLLRLPMLRLW